MIYLVVLGPDTRWGFASPATRAMRDFPAGVHEADPETEAFVRAAGNAQLVLVETDEPPQLTTPPKAESWRSLRDRAWKPSVVIPRGGEVLLSAPQVADRILRVPDSPLRVVPGEGAALPMDYPLDFPCKFCTRRYPSWQARDRHTEVHHGTELQAAAYVPEPPPSEPALTDA